MLCSSPFMLKAMVASGSARPYSSKTSWVRPTAATELAERVFRAVAISVKVLEPDSAYTGEVIR